MTRRWRTARRCQQRSTRQRDLTVMRRLAHATHARRVQPAEKVALRLAMALLLLGDHVVGLEQLGQLVVVAAGVESLPVRAGHEAVAVVRVDHLEHRRARVLQRLEHAPLAMGEVCRVRDVAVAGQPHARVAQSFVSDDGKGGHVGGCHGAHLERHGGEEVLWWMMFVSGVESEGEEF